MVLLFQTTFLEFPLEHSAKNMELAPQLSTEDMFLKPKRRFSVSILPESFVPNFPEYFSLMVNT